MTVRQLIEELKKLRPESLDSEINVMVFTEDLDFVATLEDIGNGQPDLHINDVWIDVYESDTCKANLSCNRANKMARMALATVDEIDSLLSSLCEDRADDIMFVRQTIKALITEITTRRKKS